MQVLPLTLQKKPFDVMITGEKQIEVREPSQWVLSRVQKLKVGSHIKFIHGYGGDKPYFIAVFLGFKRHHGPATVWRYSNGLNVTVRPGSVLIQLGEIVQVGNLPANLLPGLEKVPHA